MSFASEFEVVDLVAKSQLATSGVDAFSLSIVKMERQMRKLFTYLVYQARAFSPENVEELRQALGASRKAYFEGFERGINELSAVSIEKMVGQQYDGLRPILVDALDVRNKVFHGQLTMRCLQRDQLEELTNFIKRWCNLLADGANRAIGYDGFGRNSFRKGPDGLAETFKIQIDTVEKYRAFIRDHVERP
ncbi:MULTISPECIES: hypothetical protein [Burkholderia cepacia complex]|uniref:hypothetical protein n=1 Tax=Burkholderia cepacia complex TaxID=87882 RepID=UPI001583EA91|nr:MULTISPECIES: hypothetical protein [Burkholderia cepacia complex]